MARLDLCSASDCEDNPPWAAGLHVPPRVCGPHIHSWALNRDHVLRIEGWGLPCREPLQAQIRRFDQAFPWLMDQINVTLTSEQRLFEPPVQLL